MATKSGRDPQKEKYWLGIVQEWFASDLSQMEFCRQKSISDKKFYFWRRELKKRGLVDDAPAKYRAQMVQKVAEKVVEFVPVKIKGVNEPMANPAIQRLEIVTPGGYVVRIP